MVVSAVDVFCRLTKSEGKFENVTRLQAKTRRGKVRSKSVHFADSKGLALVSTFLFTKESFSPPENRRKIINRIKDNKRRIDPCEPAQLLNFASPLVYEELQARVNDTNVCLENIVCYSFGIYGRVRVKNIAYEKRVSIRYTFDAWSSSQDEDARYIPGASSKNADTFFFHMRAPQTSTDRRMEFAIRYQVCGNEFWDNNFGDNYRLIYYQTKPRETMELAMLNDRPNRNI